MPISDDQLDYIVEHNPDPVDFLFALTCNMGVTNEEALSYMVEVFGYKYSIEELSAFYKKFLTQQ